MFPKLPPSFFRGWTRAFSRLLPSFKFSLSVLLGGGGGGGGLEVSRLGVQDFGAGLRVCGLTNS